MGSTFGQNIKLSVFGESHGEAIGCVIDGLPAGFQLDMEAIRLQMRRRAPGSDPTATPRKEKDEPIILSGVLNGCTTGAPLAMMIQNTNTKSGDYANLRRLPRPSHSDYPAYVKYGGFNDIRGGGHFSGRLTAPVVFAGAIARQLLAARGIEIGAHIRRIGAVCDKSFDLNNIPSALLKRLSESSFALIDPAVEAPMREEVERYRMAQNSIGGEVECAVTGLPVGIGSNMFDTVEGKIASAVFAVPAVKGVQFGLGFGFAEANAQAVNDAYTVQGGQVRLLSNNNGGVLGGMTSGAPVVFSAVVKPTSSISAPQQSVDLETMTPAELVVHGRHDPCIVPRAVGVIEAAAAIAVLDLMDIQ